MTDANISAVFDNVQSDVERERVNKNQERLQTELLSKIKEDEKEIERQEKVLTVKRLLEIAQSNFIKMVRNPKIGKFFDDKFQKRANETDSSFVPYFRYILGKDYFPGHVVITRQLELKINWLLTDTELNEAIRVLTALSNEGKLFIEFLLKDWDERAEFIGKVSGTNLSEAFN
ncbi:MAG: hypothetical protein Q7S78_02630 [Candidatus Azambacteria bacterium]|nr:hypothetical protein [Candidatus Azambacteria bacterium]